MKCVRVRPLALDITIWTRRGDADDPLDAVVTKKLARGKEQCGTEGLRLQVWAADTYGALHPGTLPW